MTRSGLLTLVALITACDAPLDELSEAADIDESEPADQSRTKDEGGPNGDYNYCDGATPCAAGEGDCDNDGQCAAGLVCGLNNGGQFGLQWSRDMCVEPSCTNNIQDNGEFGIDIGANCGAQCGIGVNGDVEGYCTPGCPCAQGEGDCDSNSECEPGLACAHHEGLRFGLEELDDVCVGVLGIADLQVGDLVITEIMSNPNAVTDSVGEWFEIFNNSRIAFDLNGLLVRHNAGNLNFTVQRSLVIQPRSYMVFAKNGNAAVNGGITEDFDYVNTFTLNDTSDSLILDNGPLDIDRVVYNALFPNPVGASMELSLPRRNVVDNNTAANWCPSIRALPAGDKGTPGANNRTCP